MHVHVRKHTQSSPDAAKRLALHSAYGWAVSVGGSESVKRLWLFHTCLPSHGPATLSVPVVAFPHAKLCLMKYHKMTVRFKQSRSRHIMPIVRAHTINTSVTWE